MKSAVAASSAGLVGRPASRRVIPRNARIIGKAEGNIIATIMTTRSAKKKTRSVDRNREGAVSAIRTSAEFHVAYQAAPTARATAAATGTVRCGSSQAGSAGTMSTMPGSVGAVTVGWGRRWARAIAMAGGTRRVYVDAKAKPDQREAIQKITGGKQGGAVLAIPPSTPTKSSPAKTAKINFKFKGVASSFAVD